MVFLLLLGSSSHKTDLGKPTCHVFVWQLGPPARCPFTVSFFGEASPTKIDFKKKVGTLIPTSLLEDLGQGRHKNGPNTGRLVLFSRRRRVAVALRIEAGGRPAAGGGGGKSSFVFGGSHLTSF